MIKQLSIQVLNKRKRYSVTIIVLFLAFFVLTMLLNTGYIFAVKSFMARLPVQTVDRVQLYLDWKTDHFDMNHLLKRKHLKQKIQHLPNVQSADYVINDIVDCSLHASNERYSDNSYLYYCGEELNKVFDFTLEQGNWFSDEPIDGNAIPAVITQSHAKVLGIKELSANTNFNIFYGYGSRQDSVKYRVSGIISDNIMLYTTKDLERSLHPIFISARVFEKRFKMWSKDEHLIIKMKDGYDFDQLNQQILAITDEMESSGMLFQHSLNPIDELVDHQIREWFSELKLLYGILFILLSYIFITLFGSFWKITKQRTHEAGIRRALGHTRQQVVIYLLLEPLVLLFLVLLVCSLVYFNMYAILGIKYPLPIWFITTGLLFFIVIIATWLPASTAGKVQPVKVLGNE